MYKILFFTLILISCSSNNINTKTEKVVKSNEKYLLLKGANLYSNGKKDEALQIYKEILKINSSNIIALREKAIVEAELGNYSNAEKDLEQVLKLSGKDELALKNLGYLNFKKKNYPKSLEYLTSVPEYIKSNQDYAILGYISYLKKDYISSIKYYEKVEDIKIFNDTLFFNSYLENFSNIDNTAYKNLSFVKLENKVKYNKNNTIILAKFYSDFLKREDLAENILKSYLLYNELDNDILNNLAQIYKENNQGEKLRRALELISN